MTKILAAILLILSIMCCMWYNVTATQKAFYNEGYHKEDGGRWLRYERDTEGWYHCDTCQAVHKF